IRETLAHQAGWEPWIPYYKDMMEADGTYKKKFFRADSSAAFPIRLRDGLYLTSGYYAYIKKQIKHSNFDPERGFIYSGLFFYMVPEIVETLTGKKMDVYLEETFYGPLGAATVGFNPMNRYPVERIVPTEIDDYFRNFAIHGVVHDEGAALMDGVSGNAGLFANAADLAKVWAMFMNNGQMDSLTFLSPSTLDLFTTVQFPNENNHRGLGFNKPFLVYNEKSSPVAKAAGFRSFGHTGYTGPLVWVDPDTDLLFIFLCNRVYPTRNQTRIYELNIRPRLHALSYELIR
ncbi:MAG: serine hydrolase, partial [Cyclobacteriaceae bacterium]|nr:serine hydrolase [Cyclobacteriaceae bacterium]